MHRAIVEACLPWMAVLLAAVAGFVFLARLSGGRLRVRKLRFLHRDQSGSVQSLSFVLTLPFLVMILLFIVQVSQLMIGTMVVHYAAFAAARAAIVWIPADLGGGYERENCISRRAYDPDALNQTLPILDPTDDGYGPMVGNTAYVIEPGSPKFLKIQAAAVLACMSISPSRNVGAGAPAGGAADVIKTLYRNLAPSSRGNARVPQRLDNKLAYSLANTRVEIRFLHKGDEPPLTWYNIPPEVHEFLPNEVGWQDPITVKVTHPLALLPGPGRLLARWASSRDVPSDEVSRRVGQPKPNLYVYPLSASVTLGNEGEKSLVSHVNHLD
jgi:hypothetical protein